MTAEEYRTKIAALGLSLVGAAAFLGVGERTSRRWAADGDIPESVAMLLRLMVAKNLKPETVVAKYGDPCG